jgi:hypothetical protein
MLKLNILSQKTKKEIKLLNIYKHLKRLNFFVFSFLLIYIFTFQAAKIILQKYSTDSYNTNLAINKDNEEYINKVKEVNEKITEAKNIQDNFVYWSKFLLSISDITPSGVTFSKITTDKNNDSFILMGRSKSRNELLSFKQNLEELDYIETIELPINNLLQKEDINFTINAKFLSYEF